jgi:hypothetical protein
MDNNAININKTNTYLSPKTIEHKKSLEQAQKVAVLHQLMGYQDSLKKKRNIQKLF